MESTSTDGDDAVKSKLSGLSPDDRRSIVTLYQEHPKMWQSFRLVVDLTDHLHDHAMDYQRTRDILLQILVNIETPQDFYTPQVVLGKFCVLVGAVEVLVNLYRQICQAKGRNYVAEMLPPFAEDETWCVYFLKTFFLILSCFGMEFRLCLARTGFLQDFVIEDLRHTKHLSSDALKNGHVYIESMGTLFNCCRHPEVVQILRQKPVVDDVLAFVDKDANVIKGLALITLAFLVEDRDLDLIELDCDTLQYFLDTTSASFTSQGRESEGWQTDAVVHGLSHFARNEVNRRRIVAQGGLQILVRVLDLAAMQVQKDVAMETLVALTQDPGNVYVFKMDRNLGQVLERLKKGDHPTLRQCAATLITQMTDLQPETEEITDDCQCDFLCENSNAMAILGIGVVEYILDSLDTGSAAGTGSGTSTGSGTGTGSECLQQVLQALLFTARDDNKKREIFARGCLDMLRKHLEKGDEGVKEQVLNVIGALASSAEYGEIIQSHRGLGQVTRELTRSGNVATSQAASRLQLAIKDVTSKKASLPGHLNKAS